MAGKVYFSFFFGLYPIPFPPFMGVSNASFILIPRFNLCIKVLRFILYSFEYLNNYEMQLSNVLDTIEIAKANNMEVLLKKNLKLKEELENIIKTVKENLK